MPIGVRMKLSHFAILALVAPIALAAQQPPAAPPANPITTAFRTRRSEEHTSELQSQSNLVCRLLLEKKNAANLTLGGKQFENGRELLSCMSFGDSFSFPDRVSLLALLDAAILKAFGYPAIKNGRIFL